MKDARLLIQLLEDERGTEMRVMQARGRIGLVADRLPS
jgi:hypothetical protein